MRTDSKICQLVDMEQYYQKITEKELAYETERNSKQKKGVA